MNKALIKRLEALEQRKKPLMYTVYYKSGKTQKAKPADVIRMALADRGEIERFEESEPYINDGCVQGLCNALLAIPDNNNDNDEVINDE